MPVPAGLLTLPQEKRGAAGPCRISYRPTTFCPPPITQPPPHHCSLHPTLNRRKPTLATSHSPPPPSTAMATGPGPGDSPQKRQRSISASSDADDSRPSKKQALSASSPLTPGPSSSSISDALEKDVGPEVLDALEVELGCACCAGLLYRPALLQPCNHAFCASCVVSWVRNGGTACPTCRSPSDSIHQARFLQGLIDLLIRFRPEAERSAKEREEADAVWLPGQLLPLPPARPRHVSPPPLPLNLARPCPHCTRNNGLGYLCPVPIPDPSVVPRDQAWDLEARGAPQGHGFCSGCDELYALGAPTSMGCSFCRSRYCGYSVQQTCVLPRVGSPQMPRHMDTVAKLLECDELYEAFSHNSIEVDLLIDYLHTRPGGLNGVLRNMLDYVRSQPEGFATLSFLGMEGGVGDPGRHNGEDDSGSEHDSDSDDDEGEPEVDLPPSVHPEPPSDDDHVVPAPGDAVSGVLRALNEPPVREPGSSQSEPTDMEDDSDDGASDMDVDDSFVPPPSGLPVPPAGNVAQAGPVPVAAVQPPLSFTRICRDCAESVFIWGIFGWWAREQREVEGAVPPEVRAKKDCVDGRRCELQGDVSHAKECTCSFLVLKLDGWRLIARQSTISASLRRVCLCLCPLRLSSMHHSPSCLCRQRSPSPPCISPPCHPPTPQSRS
ncbi:hypothetical protein CALVIDRAFT_514000 [Calocera viscosa TUFC12733]|uniref:RING-type domain-containing protein n=1 Tax=Calocera viscosa (strain TUFC12733) TaxID=1330018 RepID=A0A167MYI7_CALVF|nr:hypothetical protein CALVIDRAFT_514000 [Calocera viscosa TUFC12733]